jgi:putative oxidoreductase
MALTRRIARPMLASIFVVGGLDAVRHPASKADKAAVVTEPLGDSAGGIPLDPETLVRINGAVQIGAGVLLATGRFRRLASLALIGSIIPTTYAGHRFWEETDPATRAQQKIHFLKNLGLLGGLILAAFDTEGEPSLGWRAKRRAHQVEQAMALGKAVGQAKARGARKHSEATASGVSVAGRRAIRRGNAASRRAGRRVGVAGLELGQKITPSPEGFRHAQEFVADAVRQSGGVAAHAVQEASSAATSAARQLPPLAQKSVHSGKDVIGPYLASSAERTLEALAKI